MTMKRILVLVMAVIMAFSCMSALAERDNDLEWRAQKNAGQGYYVEGLSQEEFDALTKTTIIKDPESPTGYTVTFRHYAPDATRVRIRGEWSMFQPVQNSLVVRGPFDPENWEDGMLPLNVTPNAQWPAYDLVKNEETGVWSYTIPLPSGTWSYRFYEGGAADAEPTDYTDATPYTDVNNEPWKKDYKDQGNSQVRVPFDPEKQTKDMSVQMPRTDGKTGMTELLFYDAKSATDAQGTPAAAVYLPYGYDPNREEPYKVLYTTHGGGQESETSWYNKGSMAYMNDNLIADGRMEPMIVVSTNNIAVNWSVEALVHDLIPAVEENYNVSKDPNDRAVCGFSGAVGDSTFVGELVRKYTDSFGYFGIFTNSTPDVDYPETLKEKKVYFGNGYHDPLFLQMVKTMRTFRSLDIDYDFFFTSGGHDWDLWRQVYEDFVTRFLWK